MAEIRYADGAKAALSAGGGVAAAISINGK
jgi:hypothetical protein